MGIMTRASALDEGRKEVKSPHLAQQASIWKCSAWEQPWIRDGQAAQEEKPHFLLVKTRKEQVDPHGNLLRRAMGEHPSVSQLP